MSTVEQRLMKRRAELIAALELLGPGDGIGGEISRARVRLGANLAGVERILLDLRQHKFEFPKEVRR